MAMTSPSTGTSTTDKRTVVGVFDGPNHAEKALNELKDSGFGADQVSVVAQDKRETREMVESTGMGAEGAGTGAFLGGITGGVLGWLVGIGALMIPGVGPVVAAGALATTLGGAALGAVAGGLIGALVDAGVPEEDAKGYEESVRQGSILLTVQARTDEEARKAHQIFDRHGGSDVRGYGFDTTRRDDDDDDSAAGEMTTGSLVGGSIGGVTGAAVGGPVGLAAGAAVGGSLGAAAGGAAHDAGEASEDTDDDVRRRPRTEGTTGTNETSRTTRTGGTTETGGTNVVRSDDMHDRSRRR
jgi:hypothetical protein